MTRNFISCVAVGLSVVIIAQQAAAQTGDRSVVFGISAYRSLEYDSAAAHFRRAIAATGRDSLYANRRSDVYAYLGASELLRGDSLAASNAFARAMAIDPRYRIDDFLFPPAVTTAFEAARLTTGYFVVTTTSESVIRVNSDSLNFHVVASAPLDATVAITRQGGALVRTLHSGALKDSLDVKWDGKDNSGNAVASGELLLVVRSARPATHSAESRLTLNVERFPVDTIVHPAAPSIAQSRTRNPGSSAGLRALVVGTLVGGAAIFLPEVVGKNDSAMPERYVIGGSLGAAGIIGYLRAREQGSRARTDSMVNQQRMANWRSSLESVRQENARRLSTPRLRITATPQRGGQLQ